MIRVVLVFNVLKLRYSAVIFAVTLYYKALIRKPNINHRLSIAYQLTHCILYYTVSLQHQCNVIKLAEAKLWFSARFTRKEIQLHYRLTAIFSVSFIYLFIY